MASARVKNEIDLRGKHIVMHAVVTTILICSKISACIQGEKNSFLHKVVDSGNRLDDVD